MAIEMRLEALKPQGSTAFGSNRPHATVSQDDPILLGALVEFRLRRQPDFTNSPTRRWLEEEHQRLRTDLRKSGTKLTKLMRRKHLAQAFLARPLDEQAKFDQQRKKGKKS
jgi:hypothetical protein